MYVTVLYRHNTYQIARLCSRTGAELTAKSQQLLFSFSIFLPLTFTEKNQKGTDPTLRTADQPPIPLQMEPNPSDREAETSPYIFTAVDGLLQPQQLHDQVISEGLEARPSSGKLLYIHKWNFCKELEEATARILKLHISCNELF